MKHKKESYSKGKTFEELYGIERAKEIKKKISETNKKKKNKHNELIYCACGCGQKRLKYNKYGKEGKYIYKHTWNKGLEIHIPYEELYQKYIVEGCKMKEIAKMYNVSYTIIDKRIKNYKIPIRKRIPWNKGLTTEVDERVRKYVKKHSEAIKGKYSGFNNKKISKNIKIIPKEYLYNEYIINKKSCPKIAKEVGLNYMVVYNHLRLHKIPIRSMHENMKGKLIGEKNPSWLGGISFEPYGLEFNEKLRELIRKRDNYRCQQCFREQSELFRKVKDGKIKRYKLSIHHIDFNKQNNNPNNLISLCTPCHMQTNFKRDDWINYFQKRLGD